jgi:hypothetical protein
MEKPKVSRRWRPAFGETRSRRSSRSGGTEPRRRVSRRLIVAGLFAVLLVLGALPLLDLTGTASAAECVNVSGKIVRSGQSGMTATTSTNSPNLPVGSRVRISANDRDRPAGSRSVVVTITDSTLLPGGVCLDLSSEAWQQFDPQDAAYRHATVTVLSRGGGGDEPGNAPDEDTPDEDTPDEDAPDEDAPDEDAPDEDAPDEDVPGEDEEIPGEDNEIPNDDDAPGSGDGDGDSGPIGGACGNVSGKIVRSGQSGMTAVASINSPLEVGQRVRISASDRDRPTGSRTVTVTISGKELLPGGICLDMSSEAWQAFDPQDAAYRHADVSIVG